MKCIICGKRSERDGFTRYCDTCGAELVDCDWEAALRLRLGQLVDSRFELDFKKERGQIGDAQFALSNESVSGEIADIEAQIESLDTRKEEIKSRFVAIRLDQSGTLVRQGQLRHASEALEPALRVEPSNPELHMQMARILSAFKRPDEALRAAKYAQHLAPCDLAIEEYVVQLESMYSEWRRQKREEQQRGHAMSAPAAARCAPVVPQPEAPRPPRPPKPPKPPRTRPAFGSWISGLVEKGLLRWWYFVGTFILLAGVIGLVTWKWNVVGNYFVFSTVTAVTAGLYVLGHYLARRIELGSTIILTIASLLVPLDIYLFSYYKISGVSFNANLLGVAGAIIAAVIYAVNFYKTRNQALVAFMSLTPLALLFFILRGSGASVHFWGLWFVGLVVCYFAASWLMRRYGLDSYSRTLFALGNATIVLALLTTVGDIRYFIGAGMRTSGILLISSAAALLIGSYTYDDKVLPYVSSVLILAASFFLVRVPGTAWYLAAPALATAAGVLVLLGFIDSKVYPDHDGRPFIYTGIVAVLAILATMAGKDFLFNIPRAWRAASGIEIRNSMITAAIASGLLWMAALLERKKYIGYLGSAAMIYASLIGLGYWSGSMPVWCLAEATVVGGTLMALGFVLEKFMGDDWSLAGYIPGFVVAGASTIAAGIYYLPAISPNIVPELRLHPHAYLGAIGAALAMTIYLVVATVRTRKAGFLFGACASLLVAGMVQAHAASHWSWVRAISGHGVNYGMLVLPLAAAFGIAGHALRKAGRDDLALAPLAAFGLVSAFAFGSQFACMAGGASLANAITLGALGLFAAAETALWKRGEFIYAGAAAALLCAGQLVALGLRGSGIESNYLLFLTPIAAAFAIAGAAVLGYGRSEKYAVPALVSAGAFAAAGFVYEIVCMAQGMTYSVSIYMLGWALVAVICTALVRLSSEEGGWKATMPVVAASVSIAHLAVGVGWLAWTASQSFAVVAYSLAGLGLALSVALSALGGRLPRWLEYPLLGGSIATGLAGVICSLQIATFARYDANVVCVLALTMTLFLQGFLKREQTWLWGAIGAYATMTLVSFLCMIGREAGTVTHGAIIWQCASLAIACAFSIAVSELYDDVFAHAAGHVFAILAWIGLGWVLHMYPASAGYWLAGAGILFAATSFISYTRNMDRFTDIGLITATGLFAAAIIQPMALGLRTETIVTMSLALAASATCVFLYGKERLSYLPLGISAMETIYILATIKPRTGPESLAGLVLLGPAILYLGIGWLLRQHRTTLSDIFLQFAAGFTVLGTLAEIAVLIRAHGAPSSGGMLMVAALFTAASIYAAIAVMKEYHWLGHASFAHFFFGYVLILVNGHVSMPHLYFLPAGIYLIALGYWAERVGYGKRTVQVLHLAGFTILALSSLIPSLSEHGGWNAAILLTESVAAIGVSFWQRRKVFLGAGLTFIVIDGIVRLWTPATSLHWSVYAVLVGALVIVGGILFETKRELLLEKGTDVIETLRGWK
ncbi:MAG: SCO7613 C-terminal domain-containing membrane protein [Candidatus Geothermincolia bacterium]